MNYQRVLAGGLLAGVVFAVGGMAMIVFLGPSLMAAREAAHLPMSPPNPGLSIFETLLTGLLVTWLYAAIRPRFGPGYRTGLLAGFVLWIAAVAITTIHLINDDFGLPSMLLVLVAVGMLPASLASGVAGAWLYRE